jgi:hypothetical protein
MDLANQLNLVLPETKNLIKNFENAVQLKSKVTRRLEETQSHRGSGTINIYDHPTKMPRKTPKEGPTVISSSTSAFPPSRTKIIDQNFTPTSQKQGSPQNGTPTPFLQSPAKPGEALRQQPDLKLLKFPTSSNVKSRESFTANGNGLKSIAGFQTKSRESLLTSFGSTKQSCLSSMFSDNPDNFIGVNLGSMGGFSADEWQHGSDECNTENLLKDNLSFGSGDTGYMKDGNFTFCFENEVDPEFLDIDRGNFSVQDAFQRPSTTSNSEQKRKGNLRLRTATELGLQIKKNDPFNVNTGKVNTPMRKTDS